MHFGLYFIPSKTNFYELGSKILGYDIVEDKTVDLLNDINKDWVGSASTYGFHLTIVDAVEIENDQLDTIKDAIAKVLQTITSGLAYEFKFTDLSFWENDDKQVAIKYASNLSVMFLHTVLVSLIQSKGKGSMYTEKLKQQLEDNCLVYKEDQVAKIELFHSPYIFEHFKPHFTLLNSFKGTLQERMDLLDSLRKLFSKNKVLRMDKLCMVTKRDADTSFKIYKTFDL